MRDRRVIRVLEFLEYEWNRPIRVSELAARVGLGASRLQALFKAQTLTSIRCFLLERRLARAAELIACTDERVSQIAWAVGFRDVPNFNHAFKRRFGMSPRDFRLRAQIGDSSSDQELVHRTNEIGVAPMAIALARSQR